MFTLRSLAISAVFASTSSASKHNSNDRELVVAIYGGGLASATLAQALKGSSNLGVQYFDPALDLTPTSFRLFGFDPKVHDALALVNEEAGGAIERAGWYPEEPSVVVVVSDNYHSHLITCKTHTICLGSRFRSRHGGTGLGATQKHYSSSTSHRRRPEALSPANAQRHR